MSRILIVDDELSILSALLRVLTLAKCRVGNRTYPLKAECFSNPEEALEKARYTAYDLVLSDYRMPGMDGVQLLKAIREIQPHAQRIILSGYTDLNGLIGAINEAHITRFIAKPWNDFELVSAIGQALALREALLENAKLADQFRLGKGMLSPQDIELHRLEVEEPGLTHVNWGPDGSVIVDPGLLDD